MIDFGGKKILIMGLGTIGKGLKDALFFYNKGAIVTVTDLKSEELLKDSIDELKKYKNINLHIGYHDEKDFIENEIIVRNPDVPFNSKYLELARNHGNKVIMDESYACKLTDAITIGITGTRGKTTTSTLVYEILKNSGKDVYLSGNVRGSATLPLVEKLNKGSYLVLELSSWQLQGFKDEEISPKYSIITNIYEDHLNRGAGMDEYVGDKKNIYRFQNKENFLFLNKDNDDKYYVQFAKEAPSKIIYFSKKDVIDWKTSLFGDHNLENIASARALCLELGVSEEIIRDTVANFSAVEFRLQKIREINKITFINDAASTAPIAGVRALESFDKKVFLICGGATKGLGLDEFAKTIVARAKKIALLQGTETMRLKEKIEFYGGKDLIMDIFDNFEIAIKTIYSSAQEGEIILLSPGCASFGMFKNEFDRGEQFNKIVNSL